MASPQSEPLPDAEPDPPAPRPRRMLGQTPASAPFTADLPPAVTPHIGERDDDEHPDPDLYDEPPTEWREAIGGAEGDPLPLPERSERTGHWKDWTQASDPYAHDQYDDEDDGSYDAQLVDYGGGGPVHRSSGGTGAARIVAGVAVLCLVVGLVVIIVGVNMSATSKNSDVAATATAPGNSVFGTSAKASAEPTVTTGPAGPASVAVPEPGLHATANCTRIRSSAITTGANPGDDKDAPGVILALEYAYYVLRDGAGVYGLLAPGTKLGASSAEELQAYLDEKVPAGTKYCVKITPYGLTGNQWAVDIDEQQPGKGIDHLVPQLISTVTSSDGKTYITAIAER